MLFNIGPSIILSMSTPLFSRFFIIFSLVFLRRLELPVYIEVPMPGDSTTFIPLSLASLINCSLIFSAFSELFLDPLKLFNNFLLIGFLLFSAKTDPIIIAEEVAVSFKLSFFSFSFLLDEKNLLNSIISSYLYRRV